MKIYTPKAPIKSGSHNARFDPEIGYHWPHGERFKILKRHWHCQNMHLEQIEGEQVIVCIKREKFPELFEVIR